MITGRIHSTESFGTVDGPGIRFVVFLQGCPLRCAYCHNPDTWDVNGGMEKTAAELLNEYDSYKEFLKGGGITVTGGEPLVQIAFVTELFTLAKEKGIHTCLDTSGITFTKEKEKEFLELLSVTDLVMLDIKEMDAKAHRSLTGKDNAPVLAFAKFVSAVGCDLWIRYVAVPTVTDGENDLVLLGQFLAGLSSLKGLDVLPYHTMGVVKYEQMKIPYRLKGIEAMGKEEAKVVRDKILRARKEALIHNKR